MTFTINITIEIPALSRYVAYLEQRDGQQPQIDQLRDSLKTSTDKLAAAQTAVSNPT
jgi:hypothetical protein